MTSRQLSILMSEANPALQEWWRREQEKRHGVPRVKTPNRSANKTEARYAARLALQKKLGEIRNYRFTGHRRKLLKLGTSGRHFNPDFVVILNDGSREWHEVKGGYVRPDAVLKFDVTAQFYPDCVFRMWQYNRGAWKEIRVRNLQEQAT